MPGLSFLINFRGGVPVRKPAIVNSLDSLLHTPDYTKTILLDNEWYFLASTQYEQYPLTSFENSEFQIYLEGKIYGNNPAAVHKELEGLATNLFRDSACGENNIKEWLENRDGDFVIFVFRKASGEIAILNDALGRLPLYSYYSPTDGEFILSRELRFITNIRKARDFDRMGIAQFLLLGHPIGERTLFQGIRHVRPGSLIKISRQGSRVSVIHLDCLDFGLKQHENRTLRDNAKELVSLFSKACVSRADGAFRNVLALSGGLDSRSVAAGLWINNVPFSAITMDFNNAFTSDVKIAAELAKIFDIDWKMFELAAPRGSDCLKLLRMKAGMNYLGMSFILPFFERIRETRGAKVLYWTGDGGNKLQIDFRLPHKIARVSQLVDFIIAKHQVLPLEIVAAVTQVTKRDIIEEIESLISSYPEKILAEKYLHFYIYDKTVRWNFEGEDRNRFYFWAVAPFFSIPFFKYMIGCPEEQKTGHALYREFLTRLSPEAVRVDNANWGFSLESRKYPAMQLVRKFVIDKLDPTLKRRVKMGWRGSGASRYQVVLKQQLSYDDVKNYLVPSVVEYIIERCGKTELTTLLTVSSAIEDFVCGKSTFEDHAQASFS